jgi:hypothetical protein
MKAQNVFFRRSEKGARRKGLRNWTFSLLIVIPLSYVAGFSPCVPFSIRTSIGHQRKHWNLRAVSESIKGLGFPPLSDKERQTSANTDSQASSSKYFIPKEQLEQLQDSVDLVSVIESYGLPQFKRSGESRATCLCPFHDDRNPSLSIDGTRGIFKCFSCGAGGNVFTFIREYSKIEGDEMSFYQAVKLVNDKFSNGVSLDLLSGYNGKSSQSREESDMLAARRARITQANLAAAGFFESCLVSLPGAGAARSHLRSRGLAPQTVRAFALGFAPESYFAGKQTGYRKWGDGSLVNHLKDKEFTATEIVDAGLAVRTKKGRQTTDPANEKNITGTSFLFES